MLILSITQMSNAQKVIWMENIFNKLKADKNYYSDIERKISQRILTDPESFIKCSIRAIADELDVSQGSINNFSKKLVGNGFASLKLQIAKQLSTYDRRTFDTVSEDDSVKSVLNKTSEQIACLYLHGIDVETVLAVGTFYQLFESAFEHVGGIYPAFRIAAGKSDGKAAGAASEIEFGVGFFDFKDTVIVAQMVISQLICRIIDVFRFHYMLSLFSAHSIMDLRVFSKFSLLIASANFVT